MRRASSWTGCLLAFALAACGSAPPRPPPLHADETTMPDEPEAPADHEHAPAPGGSPTAIDTPERSVPPSTATYEQAMSTPEQLDVNDARPHLNDDQLRGPMRGAIAGCALPPNAKVTIRTAVQHGRAIGVTVDVRFEHRASTAPPSKKRPSAAELKRAKLAAQREEKAKKRIASCIDHRVRAIVWPPSGRRDSFTTDF